MDVGEHAALGDRDAREELGELLVVADRELDVARDDARLLVVARGVAGELENLGGEVLEDGGEVDRGAGADAGCRGGEEGGGGRARDGRSAGAQAAGGRRARRGGRRGASRARSRRQHSLA